MPKINTASGQNTVAQPDYAWMILAGGQGRRMGFQDKGWIEYQGQTLIEALLALLSTQHPDMPVVISANQQLERYQALGVPVIKDSDAAFQGPLAGVLSVMLTSPIQPKKGWLTWPVDAPFRVADYGLRMLAASARSEAIDLVLAQSQMGEDEAQLQSQYTHLLIHPNLVESLQNYLKQGNRSIQHWIRQIEAQPQTMQRVTFEDPACSIWINFNTPDDLR